MCTNLDGEVSLASVALYQQDTRHASSILPRSTEELENNMSRDDHVLVLDYRLARDLQQAKLPDLKWAINPILPEGLIILAGGEKMGKSRLLLNMLIAKAKGSTVLGHYPVEAGDVLYLCLEDGEKLLQSRLNQIQKNGTGLDLLPSTFTYVCMRVGWTN